MKPAKIASFPQLLLCSVEANLKPTVDYLTSELKMKPEKIASYPQLLICSVEANLKPTVDYLTSELKMKPEKIALNPELLWCSVEANLKPTVDYLTSELKMKPEKIASFPQLLKYNVEANLKPTVDYLTSELKMNPKNIINQPCLLGYSVETVKQKVADLKAIGLNVSRIHTCPQILWKSVETNLKPTFEWLRDEAKISGVDPSNCANILMISLDTLKLRMQMLRDAGIPHEHVKMRHLKNMKVARAQLAWDEHGHVGMGVKERLSLLMTA
eukprot:6570748-Prymnesium_polylepis.1